MTAWNIVRDVVGFARALRRAGVAVGAPQTESFARAVGLVDATSRRSVYLAARATLVSRREDLPVFDAVFAAFWSDGPASPDRGHKVPLAPRHDRSAARAPAFVAYMAERARAADPEVDVPDDAKGASPVEQLQRKEFSRLTADELWAVTRAVRDLRFQPALRVTRRLVASRRGRALDAASLLRSASRHGGAVLEIPRRQRKIKRRPLVVLADISGSMEMYSRILLQFLHGVSHLHPDTETFVFGTRLTRITPQLQLRDVDDALDRAAAAIVDFGGGTRIGESLRAFNRIHAPRVLRRGAIVLVISDGWETGDPELLRAEMARIRDRCHRLLWLNPLLGRATYRPVAGGMSAALEHVDDFLPVHDLQSLRVLSRHLARVPSRAGRGRSFRPAPAAASSSSRRPPPAGSGVAP
ncbi:MAG: VWA domain-containing protein [Myxococcales bacterium]|nr:VWA domain-containing protein [Myxococcales bacterium]